MPSYRIHQLSHIDDKLIEPGTVVEVDARHIPGPHWEPMDEAAKALAKKHQIKFTGQVPDPTDKLSLQLSDALQAQGVTIDHDKLGAAIAAGLAPLILQLAGKTEHEPEAEKK